MRNGHWVTTGGDVSVALKLRMRKTLRNGGARISEGP